MSKIKKASVADLRGKKPITRKVVIYMDDDAVDRVRAAEREMEFARKLLRPIPNVPDNPDSKPRVLNSAMEKMIKDAEESHDRFRRAEEAVDQAYADLEEHAREIIFQSMGSTAFEALMAEHPPTEEQEKKHKELTAGMDPSQVGSIMFNDETFPKALIQACAVSPKMSEDLVDYIFEHWNGSEIIELFNAALSANQARRQVSRQGNG